MRVLVTGSAGFIGARVAQLLAEDGHDVVGMDSVNDAYDPSLKEWRVKRLAATRGVRFERADILDRPALTRIFDEHRPEMVLNLSARAGVRQSLTDPQTYLETNIVGTLRLLDECRRHDVDRFLLASTSSLYGQNNERPFREDADTDRPLSPYAASKKGAEALVASYCHLYGFHAAIPRYFTVYGPAGRPDMSVFRFIRWISEGEPVRVLGTGLQERDYTFVDDIARGTILAATLTQGLETYNLGGDRPVSLRTLIGLIEEQVGRRAEVRYEPRSAADVDATWADVSKARRVLGWEPKVPLEEGIRQSVAWYRENRRWLRGVDLGD